MASSSSVPDFYRVRLSVLVGDPDAALGLLEASHRQGGPECLSIAADPMFDPLRGHPRFQALARQYAPDMRPQLPG